MGTRTWSRKGILTAAGRRRAGMVGAVILDIFGDVIGDDGLPTTSPAVVTVPPPTADTPPVTPPPTSPVWMAKQADGRQELTGDFSDPNDPLSVTFRETFARLQANPDTQLQYSLSISPKSSFNDIIDFLSPSDVMAVIYEMRGWNEPPAEVTDWTNITGNTTQVPMIQTDQGTPVLFYRTTRPSRDGKVSAEQKQLDLISGREHYVGHGIFGEGTYAASSAIGGTFGGTLNGREMPTPQSALEHTTNVYGNVTTVFGLKQGSHIYQTTNRNGAMNGYARDELIKKANILINQGKGFAHNVNDIGLAAAVLGYDAYQATNNGYNGNPPYWVVLNRSAMVISNSQTDSYRIIPDALTGKDKRKS